MTNSYAAPTEGLIIVTETDYVTLYPSALESLTVGLSSLATVTVASSNMATSTRPLSSGSAMSVFYSDLPSSSLLASSSLSSKATTSALPSISTSPDHQNKSAHNSWNDRMASLSLAAIVLVILLLFSLMVYATYQRIRGNCHRCQENERQIEKYKNGELKRISPDMVKNREQSQAICFGTPVDRDVELGQAPSYSEQQYSNRQAALVKLTGPPQPAKGSIWARVRGATEVKVQGKDERAREIELHEGQAMSDPVYTETNAQITHRSDLAATPPPPQARDYDPESSPNDANSLPSPSIYSRPGASDVSPSLGQYVRGGMSNDQQPTTFCTYSESDWRSHNDIYAVEDQMRKKYRSRAYGGLPHPEDFENVDIRTGR